MYVCMYARVRDKMAVIAEVKISKNHAVASIRVTDTLLHIVILAFSFFISFLSTVYSAVYMDTKPVI